MATANHWVLDAAGGAAVVGAGFALTYLLQGPRVSARGKPAEVSIAEPDQAKDRTPS